jgi:glucose/arabinose dehydrogenase
MLLTVCSLANAVLSPGFCAYQLPITVRWPRTVVAVGTSDILVLERFTNSAVLFFDSDNDGIPDTRKVLASAPLINHGLALNDGYIYASSHTTVYRWSYQDFGSVAGEAEIVIENIDADGKGGAPQGHTTRTLAFDETGRLYISVGSGYNVDPNSFRSRIRRFDLAVDTSLPLDFQTGEVFADGLRNEVGLAFDRHGVLWGVENGPDNLKRSDLGGDIHNDNPVRVNAI